MKIGKIGILCLWAGFMMATVLVLPALAGLNAQLEVVSGKVVIIQPNKVIKLDDGMLYYPGKKVANIAGIKVGDVVTLKYFVQTEAKRVYVEYALGAGSLALPPRLQLPVSDPRY